MPRWWAHEQLIVRTRPAFGRLFFAHSVSRAGDAFNTVALVILVFRLTGSGLGVAGTVVFEVVPLLLFAPFAGVLVDRLPRRSIMVGADLVRAVLVGVLTLWRSEVVVAYVVAFGVATATVAFNPAASSVVPELVERDELVRANTALWTVAVVLQIMIAPVAGGLIALVGVAPAFGINAISFVLSASCLAGLKTSPSPRDNRHGDGRWALLTAGYRHVRQHRLLVRLALAQVLAALSAGATSALLVVLAARRLGVGPTGLGVLLGAIGLGAALGPLVLARRIEARQRRWLYGPMVLRSGVDLALSTVREPIVAGAALAGYGVGTSTGMIAFQSTIQAETPTETRGRVFTFYDTLWNAARLASLGLGGLLADAAGIAAVYVAGAALLATAAVVGFSGPSAADRRS
jgi:MFS family permease